MAYGQALRQRVLALYDEGSKTKQIAERLKVSPAWCRRVKQRRHEPPRVNRGRRPKLDAAARTTLAGWIDQQPDATLEQLRQRIQVELGIAISSGALWNTLKAMKFTFKKRLIRLKRTYFRAGRRSAA
jgi:transposase